LVAGIVVMSVVVLSGQELKHVPPAAPSYTVLHSFTFPDGARPAADLIRDSAGDLYGTTQNGGAYGNGVVFKLSPTEALTVLYSFTGGADGGKPVAGLVRDGAGNLYGTAANGGVAPTGECPNGCGVVFKVSPTGTETVLHSFTGPDGVIPYSGLVRDRAGNLYGTTANGAASGDGVVFKLSPAGTETVLYSFTGGADGAVPVAGLMRDGAGNLYGTTQYGGASGNGVVFELIRCDTAPSGYDFKVLYAFTEQKDGYLPQGGVVQDAVGNLYGTASRGGYWDVGVVFKLSLTGAETILHTFNGADGDDPVAGLIRDSAGNLYGTTYSGAYGGGVVFKVSPSGTETVLYSFTGGADGAYPLAGLVRDGAGNLYGTTQFGGAGHCEYGSGCGVVFRLTP